MTVVFDTQPAPAGAVVFDVAGPPIIPGDIPQPAVPTAEPQGAAVGRVAGAFAEPFRETQFGIPEAGIQAFQRPGGAFNAFNDLIVRGVASPAFSALQALGAGAFGAIDALAQVAVETGVDPSTAERGARDIKGLLEISPALLPVAAPAAVVARTGRTTVKALPEATTKGIADVARVKAAPQVAPKAIPQVVPQIAPQAVRPPKPGIVARRVDNAAFKKLRNTLAKDLGSKPKADRALRDWAASGADPDALIDLGGANMKRLARRTADISPDKALKRISRFIQEQPEQIRGQVGKTISGKIGMADDAIDDIQFIKATQGSEKYRAVESVIIPSQTVRDSVLPLLQSTMGKQAVRQAKKIADFDGDKEMVDTLNLILKGEAPPLNIRTIQLIKEEGLDDIIGRVKRAGGKTGRMTERKNDWLTAIDDAVPEYKDAREFYAGLFETEEAIEKGRQFMRPGKSNQVIKRELAVMNPSEKEFYRVGIADSIDDFIARKGDTADKAKLIKTEAMRQKIRVLTEDDQAAADEFIDFLQASSEQFERRRFISPETGSQTASRAAGLIEAGVIDVATGGGPVQVVRAGARAATAAVRTKSQKALYEELADAFFVGRPLETGGQ